MNQVDDDLDCIVEENLLRDVNLVRSLRFWVVGCVKVTILLEIAATSAKVKTYVVLFFTGKVHSEESDARP
jgi:hypothetical protein